MDRLLLRLAVVATAAAALEGDVGHAARVVAALAVAVLATRRLPVGVGSAGRMAGWTLLAVWTWLGNDLAHALGSPLEDVAEVAGYVMVCVGAVQVGRTLGGSFLRPVARDALLAAAAVVAITADPSGPAGSVPVLVAVGAGTGITALWLQFSLVQGGSRAVVVRLWVAVVGMVGSLALEVASLSPDGLDLAAATTLAARLAFVVAMAHPDAAELLAPPDGERDRVAGSRAVLAVVLLAAVTGVASAHQLLGLDLASVQALVPLLVLGHTTRRTWELSRDARQDNRLLRQSVRQDPLTGVLNELGLRRVLRAGDATGSVLLVVDLGGFRSVLRRLEASTAEELVRSVARRLDEAVGPVGLLARCDTAEFAVLADADPAVLARALRASLGEVLRLPAAAVSVQVQVRTGWTVVRGDDPVEALPEARFAAHEAPIGGAVRFGAEQRRRRDERRALLRDFPAAVRDEQVVAYYQPIVEVGSDHITSFEVLARWQHPVLGTVSPAVFVPLAESSGAIVQLGMHLLREACRQLATWRVLAGREDLGITVNLSPRQLAEPDLVGEVMAALDAADLPPSALTLELTEEVVADLDRGVPVLRDLQARGVLVAVDDFGTGYSSMVYLDELRPDIVKVDRRFTQSLTTSHGDVARGIFELLDGLRFPVVAEGVEDAATLDALRDLGCERWQGYLCSRPVPAGDATVLLAGAPSTTPVEASVDRRAAPAAPHPSSVGSGTQR